MPAQPTADGLIKIDPKVVGEALEGTFPGHLGIEILELSPERAVGRMAVDERHLHPGKYVHGGVWVAFADTVAAWGTMSNLRPGWTFTTSEMKINVFASGRVGDVLDAVGVPLHIGKRTQVWEVRVMKGDRLAANFICTQMCLELKQ